MDHIKINTTGVATTSYTINNLVPDSRYTFTVVARDTAGNVSSASNTISEKTMKAALLVVGNATLSAADNAIKDRLSVHLGYFVTVRTGTAATTADATGKNLIYISSSDTSGNINTKFKNVVVPVIVSEPALYNVMGMCTGGQGYHDSQNKLWIADSSQPLAAGLSGTVTVTCSSTRFIWGIPNGNAKIIAYLADSTTKAAIFTYDKGAQMEGLTAPEKRVGFFLEDKTATYLNTNGWKLFDTMVNWVCP